MSGIFVSTGLKTNKGVKSLTIDDYLNKRIRALTIHVLPLSIVV